ncbi:hypothetical protein LTR53_018134, partial [Teratosphaeriaceae sp. CCFEE 6253]
SLRATTLHTPPAQRARITEATTHGSPLSIAETPQRDESSSPEVLLSKGARKRQDSRIMATRALNSAASLWPAGKDVRKQLHPHTARYDDAREDLLGELEKLLEMTD